MKDRPVVILLIEDDETHAMLINRAFEDVLISHEIHWMSSGDEALDYLLQRGKYADPKDCPRPDLILTTSRNDDDIAKAYSNYANSYQVKPMGSDMFREMMTALGNYWLKWNVNDLYH